MRKFELQLIDVLKVQSYSGDFKHMSKFICKKINKMGLRYTKDRLGNIYVTKGVSDVYPTMVCHIDTVHFYNPNYQVHQAGRNIFAIDKVNCMRLGVGGDDKVGVFMTLKMLEERDVFKAAFFVDEEIGCIGSRSCNFDFFKDSSLVLECDRKGADDFVSSISGTKLYSREFSECLKPILNRYLRKEVSGGMTDVLEIAYNTDVCVANMSCGYYNPHTDEEFVNIDDVVDTYNLCNEIFDRMGDELWRMSEERFEPYYGYGYRGFGTGGYAQTFGDRDDFYDDFDFVDSKVNKHEDVEILECLNCGSVHVELDEINRDIYCYECDSWMTEGEYINFINELNNM